MYATSGISESDTERRTGWTEGLLRIFAQTDFPVYQVNGFLTALDHAYNALIAFDRIMEQTEATDPGLAPELRVWLLTQQGQLPPLSPERIASYLLPQERLRLTRSVFQSPGFWDFMGSLNVLEVLRKALQDRHQRQMERQFTGPLAAQGQLYKNDLLRTQAIEKRLAVVRKYGGSDAQVAPLINALIFEPLDAIAPYQDSGLIGGAELIDVDESAQATVSPPDPPGKMSVEAIVDAIVDELPVPDDLGGSAALHRDLDLIVDAWRAEVKSDKVLSMIIEVTNLYHMPRELRSMLRREILGLNSDPTEDTGTR